MPTSPHPAQPRLALAANAVPGIGGQGENLRQMLLVLRTLTHLQLFTSGPTQETPSCVAPAGPERLLGGIPYLRRRKDWRALTASWNFDRFVARHLPTVDLFQGAVGQCTQSIERARALSARTILDVVNLHVSDLDAAARAECQHFGERSFLHPRMRARIEREYRHADVIRVMSERARVTFLRRGHDPRRVVTVPPHLDVEQFPMADFAGPTFRVIFVGLLEPWKGFHYLVNAFDRAAIPDSELVLWGGPGSRSVSRYLARAIARAPSIQVRPRSVRNAGYEEVYGRASVLVHPSVSDGFGLAVAEAMASGLPVIVSDAAGAADHVRDGHNGFIVPPRDTDAMVERLRHLASHSRLLGNLGRCARDTAAQLTQTAFARRYRHLLDELR